MSDPSNPIHPCGACDFYNDSVWQPVASCSVSVLSRGYSRKDLSKGQSLYYQEDENRGVFCLSKGLVALRTYHQNGSSTLLRLAYPGDIIGFRSFLENRPHRTEARALLASRVCTVARRDAQQVVQGNPSILARLASRCISEIDRNHDRIIAAATTSSKQRLIDILLRLMKAHGEQSVECLHMQLPLSRSDLADLIGVQTETVSRLFKRIQADGVFHVSGREIQMLVDPSPRRSGSG
ncbi:Crp/Fnr family transcriptional regulator [Parasedimentitalea psychrophila]|uniref:Crp/Fnr family transcriptional regulator n=1 Tax=Parasedimentitalea psychrophila TaxID=2997337 RepID=UPI0022EB2AE4|nr:Crp/Fnr family transcriptional regulator [Parasedimentitalea psychrophila]